MQNKLGCYEVEHIGDPCLATVAVNPKEYLKYFDSKNVNKKHKGRKKVSKGMEFKHYEKIISSVREIESFCQLSPEKYTQHRFSLKNDSMILEEIKKSKFVQINDKRYYFSDGIASIPFAHLYLKQKH